MGEHDVSATAPTAHDGGWVGRVIADRYRILSLLGEGGMGAVFVAEHLGLQKEVAFKIIHPSYMGNSEVSARFSREAMTTARLEHPHIVSALDYGTLDDGAAYLVMPLVRGPSLRAIIDNSGAQPWPWVRTVACQIADALVVAHGAGVVHRDLKPDNVLMEMRDQEQIFARVTDFGIARIMEDATLHAQLPIGEVPTLTRVGVVIGTPGYMPPEQAMGQAVDARADLYAFGVVLWELLTGKPPFPGESLAQVITQQLTMELPALPDTIPTAAHSLLQRLLAADASARPDTAVEVRQLLHELPEAASAVERSSAVILRHAGKAAASAGRGAATTARWATQTAARIGRWSWPHLEAGARRTVRTFQQASPRGRAFMIAVPLLVLVGLGYALSPGEEEVSGPGVMHSVKHVVRTVIAKPPPPVVTSAITTLNDDDASARDRKAAATSLLEYTPASDVPDYARGMAQLESANTCAARAEAIATIVDADDERAVGALERLDRRPRRGCGFLGLRDCLSCVRRDLRNALISLGARDPDATGQTER